MLVIAITSKYRRFDIHFSIAQTRNVAVGSIFIARRLGSTHPPWLCREMHKAAGRHEYKLLKFGRAPYYPSNVDVQTHVQYSNRASDRYRTHQGWLDVDQTGSGCLYTHLDIVAW